MFLNLYQAMLSRVERKFGLSRGRLLTEVRMRSSVINASDRITGESMIHVTDRLVRARKLLSFAEICRMIISLIEHQKLLPRGRSSQARATPGLGGKPGKVFRRILHIVRECRDGL